MLTVIVCAANDVLLGVFIIRHNVVMTENGNNTEWMHSEFMVGDQSGRDNSAGVAIKVEY